MSFLVRPCFRQAGLVNTLTKRWNHKKADIQVKLCDYVEGLGARDEVVSVRPGLMRNTLYPMGKARYMETYKGPRNRIQEEQQQSASTSETMSATASMAERRANAGRLMEGLGGVKQLVFKRAVVPGSDHTFGSVTADDIAGALMEQSLNVERSMIEFKSEGGRIKSLGDHLVQVQIGEGSVEINVSVEAA